MFLAIASDLKKHDKKNKPRKVPLPFKQRKQNDLPGFFPAV
ncbi:hypothetical protein CKA32_006738 [Geitlerinema sp. FC II]|nr:hypothetical protein CKA32_006738 [Geitlerinema sp. FC II]